MILKIKEAARVATGGPKSREETPKEGCNRQARLQCTI
jgi:hypothetical protein